MATRHRSGETSGVQAPREQVAFAAHLVSQLPQCAGSFRVSTHRPPHADSPVLQFEMQVEPAHWTVPPTGAGQTLPQAAQLAASVVVSTQVVPQRV